VRGSERLTTRLSELEGLEEQATALVNAAASGAMPASTASELLAGLGVVGRLTELGEITAQLQALEARSGGGQ